MNKHPSYHEDSEALLSSVYNRMLKDNEEWTFHDETDQKIILNDRIEKPFSYAKRNEYGYRKYPFLCYILNDDRLSQQMQYFIKLFDLPLNDSCTSVHEIKWYNRGETKFECHYGTPLQMAIRLSRKNAVIALLDNSKVDRNVTTTIIMEYNNTDDVVSSNSLLHLAVNMAFKKISPDSENILTLLLTHYDFSEQINAKNIIGDTPFHLLLRLHSKHYSENSELGDRLIVMFMYYGANISLKNHKDMTVLDFPCIKDRNTSLTRDIHDRFLGQYLNVENSVGVNYSQLCLNNRYEGASPGFQRRLKSLTHPDSERISAEAVSSQSLVFHFKSAQPIVFKDEIPNGLHKYLNGGEDLTKNYIIAAISVLYTEAPYERGKKQEKKLLTIIVDANRRVIHCERNSDDFLNKIAKRLISINAKSFELYFEKLNSRNDSDYNEYSGSHTLSFDKYYMHSEMAFANSIESEEFVQFFIASLREKGLNSNNKIYGILIDVLSLKELCKNACADTLIALQNSRTRDDGFIKLLEKAHPTRKKNFALQVRFSFLNDRHERFSVTPKQDQFTINPRVQLKQFSLVVNKLSDLSQDEKLSSVNMKTSTPTFFQSGSNPELANKMKKDTTSEQEPPPKKIKEYG